MRNCVKSVQALVSKAVCMAEIKSFGELQRTKAWQTKFYKAIRANAVETVEPWARKCMADALQSMYDEVTELIQDYESEHDD